jgi:type IX secretion system PorP/SprF family membrane protein
MKPVKLGILFLFLWSVSWSQHQANYTQYMFNVALFNPAYAGSHQALNLTVLYRSQWTGIEGAPQTKSFGAHSPLKNKKLNLGIVVQSEKIAVFDHTKVSAQYAYRFNFLRGQLALGLSAGFDSYASNWNRVITTESNDPNFTLGATRSIGLNAGTGFYYAAKRFFLGLGAPSLLNENKANKNSTIILNSGFLCDLGANVKMKPVMLIMYLPNSPVSANVSSTFYYKEVGGFGIGYTLNSSVMALVDLRINDQFRLGYAYDYATTSIRNYSSGSHEIMLRYLFSYKVKAVNARYF